MTYISTKEAAEKWGVSTVRVFTLIQNGRIPGAKMIGNSWLIPENTPKPEDGRKHKDDKLFLWPLPIYSTKEGDDNLPLEQKRLLDGQKLVMQCRFDEATPILQQFLRQRNNIYLRLGALYELFVCSLLNDSYQNLRKYTDELSLLRSQDFPHKKDCEVMFLDLESSVVGNAPLFRTTIKDPNYAYVKEARFYLSVITTYVDILRNLKKKAIPSLSIYEMMAEHYDEEGYLLSALSIYLYIAIGCKASGDRERCIDNIRKALALTRRTDYILLAITIYHYLKDEFEEAFLPEDEGLAKKIRQYEKVFKEKYLRLLLHAKGKRSLFFSLTQEEFKLLHYARQGLTTKAVAMEMNLSENTIGKKYCSLYAKVKAKSKEELIGRLEEGLDLFDSI